MNLSKISFSAWCVPAAVALMTCLSTVADAGRPVYIGSPSHQSIPIGSINHADWNRMLQTYVNQDGMVNYAQWKANPTDMQSLDRYLASLSSVDDKLPASREETMAFWINAYNAVTVRGILREYPTSSIRNHTAKLVGYNIWKDLQLYVGGTPRSLDTMEHKILRPMRDARVHFAIVCASIGCPRLLNEAYVPSRLAEQLELNSRDFFSRPQNFRHISATQFQMSAILEWFAGDFGGSSQAVQRTIARWLPTQAAQQLASTGGASVSYLDYDWGLNAQ